MVDDARVVLLDMELKAFDLKAGDILHVKIGTIDLMKAGWVPSPAVLELERKNYEAALARNPELAGKVTVVVTPFWVESAAVLRPVGVMAPGPRDQSGARDS